MFTNKMSWWGNNADKINSLHINLIDREKELKETREKLDGYKQDYYLTRNKLSNAEVNLEDCRSRNSNQFKDLEILNQHVIMLQDENTFLRRAIDRLNDYSEVSFEIKGGK